MIRTPRNDLMDIIRIGESGSEQHFFTQYQAAIARQGKLLVDEYAAFEKLKLSIELALGPKPSNDFRKSALESALKYQQQQLSKLLARLPNKNTRSEAMRTHLDINAGLGKLMISLMAANDSEGARNRLILRASQEPYQAKTDGFIVKPMQDTLDEDLRLKLLPSFENAGLLVSGAFTKPKHDTKKGPGWLPYRDDPAGLLTRGRQHKSISSDSGLPTSASHLLALPNLVMEYKKRDDSLTKATNQCRLYLISAVKFMAALGFCDVPVFGTLTNGAQAGLFLAWGSKRGVCFFPYRKCDRIDEVLVWYPGKCGGLHHGAEYLCVRLHQSH